MSYKIFLTPSSKSDLLEAKEWYSKQRNGLGDEFITAIEAELEFISRNPHSYSLIDKNIRRALPNKFPYSIFYSVDYEKIVVIAILYSGRKPETWMKRK